MAKNRCYSVGVILRPYRARVYIERERYAHPRMYDTTPKRAAQIQRALPTGGLLEHWRDFRGGPARGWDWDADEQDE